MRIDENVEPKIWKCATVSSAELIELRKVKNIIRQGRIDSIEKDKIVFTNKRCALHCKTILRTPIVLSDKVQIHFLSICFLVSARFQQVSNIFM